jgi:hypothetical protein
MGRQYTGHIMELDGSEKIMHREFVEEAHYDIGNVRIEYGLVCVRLAYP